MDHRVDGTKTDFANGKNGQADSTTKPISHTITGMPAIARLGVHSIAVREITELNHPANTIVHGSGQLVPPIVNRVPRYNTEMNNPASAPMVNHTMPEIFSPRVVSIRICDLVGCPQFGSAGSTALSVFAFVFSLVTLVCFLRLLLVALVAWRGPMAMKRRPFGTAIAC